MKYKRKYFITILLSFICLCFCSIALATVETAIFAGGCFWSMQHDFDKLNGIIKTTVGYTGGNTPDPSYEQVSTGTTGHYEAIEIKYDPTKISYSQLVNYFWHDIDPTDASGQFCDKGNEYHSAIFYSNTSQEKIAIESKAQLFRSHQFKNIDTKILPAVAFYPAEEYHQKYSEKNPQAYAVYRIGCQRDLTLSKVWNKK